MVPAVYDQTAFEIPVNEAVFRANGQQIKFDGFMKVYTEGADERASQKMTTMRMTVAGSRRRAAGSAKGRCAEIARSIDRASISPSRRRVSPRRR